MDGIGIQLLFVILAVFDFACCDVCTEVYSYSHEPKVRTFHCSFGCCGPDYDQYCCVSHAGVIVGIVFACIFGIAFLSACVCCFLKHHGARGRIIRPMAGVNGTITEPTATHTTGVVVVHSAAGPPAYPPTVGNPYFSGYGAQTGMVPSVFQPKPPAYEEATVSPPPYTSPPPPPRYDDVHGKWPGEGTNS
ncbi:hypothetical protein EGW08_015851 [Elysia chlorotica]|uniref:Vesicular, overexpressed in cancer, prosurvival protein 1 n=1 Tax=Elysia chlorotica TaxID=188477 RepID=A0A3S1HC73_ELYCH|nr:hypothetical protein EGW08_015851 [Elysia chlorotica]